MTPPIALVTDASADVPSVERHGSNWHVVPEVWRGGGLELLDYGEQNRDLMRLVLGPTPMEVSEPGFDDFRRTYEQLADVEAVFSMHPSTQVSQAAVAAREAAGGFPNVRVIETGVTGIGVGLLSIRARDLALDGHDADSIERYLMRQRDHVRFVVVPDHFDPTSSQRLFSATLLSGRPSLSARDGTMARSRRLRTRKATVTAIEDALRDMAPPDHTIRMAVGHGDAAGAVDPLLDIVERIRPAASIDLVGRIGPRLTAQVGSRCVGVAWLVE